MSVYFPYLYKEASAPVKIVTWADGTAEELAAMLAANDAGSIDITDYWSIGDERTVTLGSIPSTYLNSYVGYDFGDGVSSTPTDVTYVLMDDHYNNNDIHFVVGQKEGVIALPMRGSNSDNGCYRDTHIRSVLNGSYYNAVPSDFRALFKEFSLVSSVGYGSGDVRTTDDYFALFSEKEVLGSSATIVETAEANATDIVEYYKTSSNRLKQRKNWDGKTWVVADPPSNTYWWTRTPYYHSSGYYMYDCIRNNSGTSDPSSVTNRYYISPFGCI